jgi:hypothetical protein
MIGLRGAAKSPGDGKNHADQNCRGNNNEKAHENLVPLACHYVLFPLLKPITSGGLA